MKRTVALIAVLQLLGLCLGTPVKTPDAVWKKVIPPIRPDIAYKYISENSYDLIWEDKGFWKWAGAEGAIWRPQNYDTEFCLLGDVANKGYSRPTTKSVAVKALTPGAVVHPTDFTYVWKDTSGLSDMDVIIWKMIAPKGYTCLGAVAMRSHSQKPDKSKYCCVKDEYVVSSNQYQRVWDSDGLGVNLPSHMSFWTLTEPNDPDGFGIGMGIFEPVKSYSKSYSGIGQLLKADDIHVKNIHDIPKEKFAPLNLLKLYEVSNLTQIWSDKGSGADKDVSIWRSVNHKSDYHSVGDVAVNSHSMPTIAYSLKASNTDDLKSPVDFSKIWSDTGSGADKHVQLWKVHCPPTFVALGDVATNGEKPGYDSISCVHKKYTERGSNDEKTWSLVWKDSGSGADADVSIYEAGKSTNTNTTQSVRGFGAVANHNSYPGTPNLLKLSAVKYYAEKPISKIDITDIEYHFNKQSEIQENSVDVRTTILRNDLNIKQKASRTIKFSYTTSSTFNFEESIEVGIESTLEVDVPIPEILSVGKISETTSFKSTTTFSAGETWETTRADDFTADITIPKHSKIVVILTTKQLAADIPYTATIIKTYYDGTKSPPVKVDGVYRGVNQLEVDYSIAPYDGPAKGEPL